MKSDARTVIPTIETGKIKFQEISGLYAPLLKSWNTPPSERVGREAGAATSGGGREKWGGGGGLLGGKITAKLRSFK